mmetsp:Transcript_115022/g.225674  ORF Transcript_115022/g.225674 Transcript_115022/m.225674 type:complete len:138 (-) Transcript_115022:84-497(-)
MSMLLRRCAAVSCAVLLASAIGGNETTTSDSSETTTSSLEPDDQALQEKVQAEAAKASKDGTEVHQGVYLYGDLVIGETVDSATACKQACKNTADCAFWSFRITDNRCDLHKEDAGFDDTSQDWLSGTSGNTVHSET